MAHMQNVKTVTTGLCSYAGKLVRNPEGKFSPNEANLIAFHMFCNFNFVLH